MLMTTKNGKAITRALALVMCVLMLLAFGTACTDENAVKLAEAANTAAEEAEAQALKANQAALDAANSAKDAMDKALAAETLAGTKLTEKQVTDAITKALEAYAKAADVATKVDLEAVKSAVAKLLTEDAIKALIAAGDDAAVAAVKAEISEDIEEILEDYATAAQVQALADDIAANYNTKAEITTALADYFKTADATALKTELTGLISANTSDIDFLVAKVDANKTAADELKAAIGTLTKGVFDDFAEATNDAIDGINDTLAEQAQLKEYAFDKLTEILEAKADIISEIRGDAKFYTANAYDAVVEAYDRALVRILTAADKAAVDTAAVTFAADLAACPTIEKDFYDLYLELIADDLVIDLVVPSENINLIDGDAEAVRETLDAITDLLGDANFVKNHPNAFTAYVYAEGQTINLQAKYTELEAEITALEAAWVAAESVNSLINSLDDTYGFNAAGTVTAGTIATYDKKAALITSLETTGAAIEGWISTYFADDTDNVNIDRMLYNRYVNISDKVDDGKLNTANDLLNKFLSLENYDNYIEALLGDGTDALTNWNAGVGGYILINNTVEPAFADSALTEIEAINNLKALYDADQAIYAFQNLAGATDDMYAYLVSASEYAAYAKDRQDILIPAEGTSALATALENLVALHNGTNYLSYTDVTAATNVNKFDIAENAYDAWYVTSTGGVELKLETVKDILNKYDADIIAELKAVDARRDVLKAAKFYADAINEGNAAYAFPADTAETVYAFTSVALGSVYDPDMTYYTLVAGGDTTNYSDYVRFTGTVLDPATQYYTATTIDLGINDFADAAAIEYYHIIDIRLIQTLVADWAERFEIPAEGETGYVAANYELINHDELADAYNVAKGLVNDILNNEKTVAFANTLRAFYNSISNGTGGYDYSTLYGYTILADTIAACNDWYIELGITKTVGITEFEALGLDTTIGNLLEIKTNKYEGVDGTYTKAVAAFNESLYTAFAVGTFDLDAYEPTIYDKYVRDAYENAKAWVEEYLDDRGFEFTDASGTPRYINSIGLLTDGVYKNVCDAYEKYNNYITTKALADLNMIIDGDGETVKGYKDFMNGSDWAINIITDRADIDAIMAKVTAWTDAYVDAGATATDADERVADYATEFANVAALDAEYAAIYAAVEAAYTANLADLVTNIGAGYTTDLYSMIHTDDALYIARNTYDTIIWAALDNASIVKTQAAYATVNDGSDALLKNLKAAIVAIEALEAEVTANKTDRNNAGAAFVANVADKIGANTNGIGTNDVANLAALRAEYNDWKNGTATLLGGAVDTTATDTYYNLADIVAAEALLTEAEGKLGLIADALDEVLAKYAALVALDAKTPDKAIVAGDAAGLAEWKAAAEALNDAVEAYKALNPDGFTADAINVVTIDEDTKIDAAQIEKIYTYRALYNSIAAFERAQAVYSEYEAYAVASKVNSLKAVRDTMIQIIVDAAASEAHEAYDTAVEVNKVESVLRAQMSAVIAATGEFVIPSYDDTKDDLDNWGPNP
ncbi:MAG: hypothetical protein E7640_02960 [Ruminococcaceae bacterium]|nr:hypothetical protein [Oscillospiraceae bacterium]